LDLKNFIYLNEKPQIREIFTLIFPEFLNLKRLEKLIEICDYSNLNRNLILATLLIDDKDSHEYFEHKYNISNTMKENLNLYSENLKVIGKNKDFFHKNLEKNIYHNGKNHLIDLNILNFVINTKVKFEDFSEILKKILKSRTYKFKIDGKYLMKNGMKQGALMGKVLKKIEEEWINNNFKIKKDRVKEIIKLYSN